MALFKRIHHVAMLVKDIDNSQSFYENHFGFETYFEHDTASGIPVVCLRLGDTVLELRVGDVPPGGYGGCYFCLESDDLKRDVGSLKKAGVIIDQEIHETTPRNYQERRWKRAVFKGPDGELIEIRGR
jgi:lactoylglutathione lyase